MDKMKSRRISTRLAIGLLVWAVSCSGGAVEVGSTQRTIELTLEELDVELREWLRLSDLGRPVKTIRSDYLLDPEFEGECQSASPGNVDLQPASSYFPMDSQLAQFYADLSIHSETAIEAQNVECYDLDVSGASDQSWSFTSEGASSMQLTLAGTVAPTDQLVFEDPSAGRSETLTGVELLASLNDGVWFAALDGEVRVRIIRDPTDLTLRQLRALAGVGQPVAFHRHGLRRELHGL